MSADQAARLLSACRERFSLPPAAETTLEANPAGLEAGPLAEFRRAGFNRLSLGVQSVDARLLKILGRRHRREDVEETVRRAREAGFQNLSVDLIYGVPRQDLSTWQETLEGVVAWGVEHISCYMLTVEPGTPMERGVQKGVLRLPAEEEVVEMYRTATRVLGGAGFRRYEISNWARPGRESAHNLVYWRNEPYLALGAGAAGYWRGQRYKIRPDLGAYLRGVAAGQVPLAEQDTPDAHRAMSDTLILGLRLEEGVSKERFQRRHGTTPEAAFGDALSWGLSLGLLEDTPDRLRLTEEGILLSNELFEKLL
jgi:oxygen-independent coproporphyrinogen-3 oxidase